jgi:hypothetical protein
MTKEELEKINSFKRTDLDDIDFKGINMQTQADIAYQLTQANEHRAILNGELRLIRSQLTRIADRLDKGVLVTNDFGDLKQINAGLTTDAIGEVK